jgi:hypothetical protein
MTHQGSPNGDQLISAAANFQVKRVQHKSLTQNIMGPERRFSNIVQNFGSDDADFTVSGEQTESATTTSGFVVRAELGISEKFKIGFEGSYSQSWTWSRTYTEEYRVTIKPGWQAWMTLAPALYSAIVDMDFDFENKYFDHHRWSLTDFQINAPMPQAQGFINLYTQPIPQGILDNSSKYELASKNTPDLSSDKDIKLIDLTIGSDTQSIKVVIYNPNEKTTEQNINNMFKNVELVYSDSDHTN